MGVPKFYRWISERYPCLSEVINDTEIPEFDNLYLDMNGIIHNCSHPNDDDVTFRITEEEIFVNIFAYIENLYNLIHPQKVFFMAVDGVAPRAKMNQQRSRRFMSARTAQEQLKKAISEGKEIPNEERFDSNCITPGTQFMTRLHNRLADWVEKKIEQDSNWQNRRIYLSGHNCPGEGEHKIMDFIRSERAKDSYDPNTRHCMYGLDADLIMLGIVLHEPHLSLLREEVKFSKPRKDHNKKPSRNDSDTITFHLLHLSLLREYLAWEFSDIKTILPFEYDMEKIADDWILMGLLIGNDFIPHLPHLHIHDGALPLLYDTYRSVLPTLDGYINEGGYLNLERFEKFLIELSKNDKSCFMNHMEDEQYMNSKRTKPLEEEEDLVEFENSDSEGEGEALEGDLEVGEYVSEDEKEVDPEVDAAFLSSDEELEEKSTESKGDQEASAYNFPNNDPVMDEFEEALALANIMSLDDKEFENNVEACWTKTINNSFKRHKKNYYYDKLKYKNISKTELKEQAEGYVRSIQWNLHYYYHGCPSWSWFYPHHYAPYISDVVGFANMKIEFELSQPFKPFEQLLAVLPEASSSCLPKPLQELMNDDPNVSPIADFYPSRFDIDLNGKKNDWEAVVLIPFIEEKRLIEAMKTKVNKLTKEENKRNSDGPHLLFTSVMKNGTARVSRKLVDVNEFRIEREKVKWGLLKNVKMDVLFPGFPTMKHLRHYGQLRYANVNVFGMASKGKSVVLTVENRSEKDVIEWAGDLLDEQVCIEWPMLKLGKVESIWGDGKIVRKLESDEILVKDMSAEEDRKWGEQVNYIQDKLITRYAVEIEERKRNGIVERPAIAWVQKTTGFVYEVGKDDTNSSAAILKPVKQFASKDNAVPVLLSLVVKDLLLEKSCRLHNLPIKVAFPLNSVVYVTNPKMTLFGFPAMVQGFNNAKSDKCTVNLIGMVMDQQVNIMEELRKEIAKRSLRWMSGYDAARNCGVNVHVFNRITGTIFMSNADRNKGEKKREISNEKKINIGLGLKFNKRNLMVAEYTQRIESHSKGGHKVWVYSNLTCQLVSGYKRMFPEIFSFLQRIYEGEDVYYASDFWSGNQRDTKFAELETFLTSLPSNDAEKLSCDTILADRLIIAEVEKRIKNQPAQMKKADVVPQFIFNPRHYEGKVLLDPDADYQLLDRVTCICSNYKIPKTTQGTVVGIHNGKIDVLFDKEFQGGSNARGSKNASAIRLPIHALLNITFGLKRKNQKRPELEDAKNQIRAKKERREKTKKEGNDGGYVPSSGKNKQKVENPKAENPKEENPKAENPKEENPKAENPKAENPKAENPKAENPKAENPKAENPKVVPLLQSEDQIQGKKISLGELMGIPAGGNVATKRKEEESMKVVLKKLEQSGTNSETNIAPNENKSKVVGMPTSVRNPPMQPKFHAPQITDLKPSTVNRTKRTSSRRGQSNFPPKKSSQKPVNSSEQPLPDQVVKEESKKKKSKNSKKESRLAINFS